MLASLACAASVMIAAGFGAIIMKLIYERNATRYIGVRRSH